MNSLQLVIISVFILSAKTRTCYNTSEHKIECEAAESWCIKFRNESGIYKGCTDINGLCDKEDKGCYPKSVTGPNRSWCCCDTDNCNTSSHINFYLTSCITTFFTFLLS